ncbi:MAG: hypothetical protein RBT15_04685 [Gudongella sp.]|jgi:hypothetical protein|nr:hypothetical protein [Gudongella sp.]
MNLYVAYGSDDSKVCEYGGVEVYIIYASCLEEAKELCPIPEHSTGEFPERVIKLFAKGSPAESPKAEQLVEYYD